jgi:tetratricopeptide (TPR) repeat protein
MDTSPAARAIGDMPMHKWDPTSCGAGALSTVLQHYGDTTTMDTWQAALPKVRGGVMTVDMLLAARQKGYDAQIVTGDPAAIEQAVERGEPVILMLKVVQTVGDRYDFFHYIVVDGVDPVRNLIRTQFGDGKARWTSFSRIDSAWEGAGRAAIFIRPKSAEHMPADLRAAVALEERGQHAEAAAAYRMLLKENPRSVLVWTNLGNAEMHRGRLVEAENAFRKAIEIDGSAADALNNLAWLLYEQKRLDEAEALARRAVDAPAPDPWTRLDTLARIQVARGACGDAMRSWEKALLAVPETRAAERADMNQQLAGTRASCRS